MQIPVFLKKLYPFRNDSSNYLRLPSGHNIHFLDEGKGETVIFLHGNPTWSFMYRDLIKTLKNHFRCIAPDHLGCGLSDKPTDYNYCLESHIENMIELVKTLDLKRFHLVIHDWGGPIGMALAQKFPARLKSMIVLNSAAFLSEKIPFRIAFCRLPIIGPFLIKYLNVFSGFASFMSTVTGMPWDVKKGYKFPYNSPKKRVAINAFVQDIPMSDDHPSYDCLKTIEDTLWLLEDKPMLICWGMKDFCFNPDFLEKWKYFFPKAKIKKYNYSGHLVLEDSKEDVVNQIQIFLLKNQ